MYERILICTDGTELSKKAVDSGIALGAKLSAEVFPFMVVPRYPAIPGGCHGAYATGDRAHRKRLD
jgi:nucleotide-binding universal stress UspA family protein